MRILAYSLVEVADGGRKAKTEGKLINGDDQHHVMSSVTMNLLSLPRTFSLLRSFCFAAARDGQSESILGLSHLLYLRCLGH